MAAAALTAALLLTPSAAFGATDEPDLDQTLDELEVVHGQRVLDVGHVDMGPKFDDGAWRFLIHDDVARADADATSVWRYPDETVLHVIDSARLTVPDDPAYAFIGADAGSEVYVVPQTQNPDVVWLGWNTQDPEVMQTIDRGITLSLTGVQGPGVVTTYLQSGSFGDPQLLWDSRVTEPQPVWVDVNTHTHANWVFTEPGVYLLELTAEADLIDGSHVSDAQRIRFAVGSATSPDDALAESWSGQTAQDAPSAGAEAGSDTGHGTGDVSQDALGPVAIVAIVVASAAIVVVVVALVRGSRLRRRVLAERTAGSRDIREAPGGGGE
ncbi:choice-of-anchor M domain-containing protein [Microbacterium sp. NPDC096154]|uniref:choice-of-anchor M domain-containing protein n=1 Tax=Microbacterium sp. NPDC096154 TaxID=3155549 RepID=UPI00332E2D4A